MPANMVTGMLNHHNSLESDVPTHITWLLPNNKIDHCRVGWYCQSSNIKLFLNVYQARVEKKRLQTDDIRVNTVQLWYSEILCNGKNIFQERL